MKTEQIEDLVLETKAWRDLYYAEKTKHPGAKLAKVIAERRMNQNLDKYGPNHKVPGRVA